MARKDKKNAPAPEVAEETAPEVAEETAPEVAEENAPAEAAEGGVLLPDPDAEVTEAPVKSPAPEVDGVTPDNAPAKAKRPVVDDAPAGWTPDNAPAKARVTPEADSAPSED